MFSSRLSLVTLLLAASAPGLWAQVAGRLTGSVVDPSGANVPGVTVNLFIAGGRTPVASTRTSQDGIYDFASVRPDTYRLEARASGSTAMSRTR